MLIAILRCREYTESFLPLLSRSEHILRPSLRSVYSLNKAIVDIRLRPRSDAAPWRASLSIRLTAALLPCCRPFLVLIKRRVGLGGLTTL